MIKNFFNLKKIKLFEDSGSTSRAVWAEINDSGDLIISAQDLGEAPEQYCGKNDYEWWVAVAAQDKDAVLLALIDKEFGNKFNASVEFREWLTRIGIPSKFACY